jgi:hypothetical protein
MGEAEIMAREVKRRRRRRRRRKGRVIWDTFWVEFFN